VAPTTRTDGRAGGATAISDSRTVVLGCSSDGGGATSPPAQPSSEIEAASSRLPQGGDPVELDPTDFTVEITNRYWPMEVGDRWVYQETDDGGG